MEEGKRSQLHGWTMRDIVSKITASYGKGVGTKAKKYILSYVPSYDPTQKENKDV